MRGIDQAREGTMRGHGRQCGRVEFSRQTRPCDDALFARSRNAVNAQIGGARTLAGFIDADGGKCRHEILAWTAAPEIAEIFNDRFSSFGLLPRITDSGYIVFRDVSAFHLQKVRHCVTHFLPMADTISLCRCGGCLPAHGFSIIGSDISAEATPSAIEKYQVAS